MNRRAFVLLILAAAPVLGQVPQEAKPGKARKDNGPTTSRFSDYLRDPRSAVLVFLTLAFVIGGGRKLLQGRRARRAIEALDDPNPSVQVVEASADHGRDALIDLFRLLGTADRAEVREAAGRAIARLWARDELIAEEEKALVRRGYVVTWSARRKYPSGLKMPISISITYGVPFLVENGPGVKPSNLEWSHRIVGGQSAALESYSPWKVGPGLASFTIHPGDFLGNGPFRLALQTKVRTVGLTESWEFELPQMPTSFEFDPNLAINALLTLPDDTRGHAIARAVGLIAPATNGPASTYVPINANLVIKDPPRLAVTPPLPCDLAHDLAIEIEGVNGRFAAGSVVVSDAGSAGVRHFPLNAIQPVPEDVMERPGEIRIRAILTANPDLGWTDPEIRSIWPGTLTTDWTTARLIRA